MVAASDSVVSARWLIENAREEQIRTLPADDTPVAWGLDCYLLHYSTSL